MKWGNLINLFTLYTSSIEQNVELLLILLLNATANDMAAKTEKSKVSHYVKTCSNVLTTKKQPPANIIDGNVQLYVFLIYQITFHV